MDIETLKDVAKLQQEFTKKARLAGLAAASTVAPDLARLAVSQREHMIEMLETRVRAVTAERDRAVTRYDEEIAGHRRALEQIRKDLDEARRDVAERAKSGGEPGTHDDTRRDDSKPTPPPTRPAPRSRGRRPDA